MGQARQRGTFEERREAAVARKRQADYLRQAREATRRNSMTQEERAAMHKAREILAWAVGQEMIP